MADVLRVRGRYFRMYPSLADPAGTAYEEIEWPLAETALVLVDVYGHPGDPGESPTDLTEAQSRIIRDELPRLIGACRAAGMRIVYVQNRLSDWLGEDSTWRTLSLRTCGVDVLETWAPPARILDYSSWVRPTPDDVVVDKQMYSGFFRTDLDETLRAHGIRRLVMAGFDSRLCLAQTAIDAMYRDYEVLAVRDCISTFEFPETTETQMANFLAVRTIETNVGMTTTADDVLAGLGSRGADA